MTQEMLVRTSWVTPQWANLSAFRNRNMIKYGHNYEIPGLFMSAKVKVILFGEISSVISFPDQPNRKSRYHRMFGHISKP